MLLQSHSQCLFLTTSYVWNTRLRFLSFGKWQLLICESKQIWQYHSVGFSLQNPSKEKVYLSGYGVELAIKSTEYKAKDDTQVKGELLLF